MFRIFRRFLAPYKWQCISVVLFVVVQVLCELGLPTVMSMVVDKGLDSGDTAVIFRFGMMMVLASILQVFSMVGVGFFSARVSASMGRDIMDTIFTKAQSFSLVEMDRIGVASMITRCTRDISTLQNFTVMCMRMVLVSPVMLVGSILLMTGINSFLSRVVFCSIPMLVLLFGFILLTAGKLFGILQKKNDRINTLLREHLSGVRVIRAFVSQKTEQERFSEANDELCRLGIKVSRIMSFSMPGMMCIINMTNVAVCATGARQIQLGAMQTGQLMSFIQYVTMLLMSLGMFSILIAFTPRAKVSAERINEVLDTQVSIRNKEKTSVPKQGTYIPGTIEFRDVSFVYENGDEPVLSHVSFTAHGGKTTAIVGSTGSGKSTVVSLIPRLYDVSEGSILLDGQDVRDYSLEDLHDKLGIVPQKAVLFSGTVADNVRFGCSHVSDEEVQKALCISQASDFVSEMPDGVNSFIAQGGKNVSGGQKQRLSIARAIVRRCEAYIFDDSFSALDYETDSNLRMALSKDEWLSHASKIIVAQRVSTVMNADCIVVLDSGRVAGIGTHAQLLKNCRIYREIASSQLSEEELAL